MNKIDRAYLGLDGEYFRANSGIFFVICAFFAEIPRIAPFDTLLYPQFLFYGEIPTFVFKIPFCAHLQ